MLQHLLHMLPYQAKERMILKTPLWLLLLLLLWQTELAFRQMGMEVVVMSAGEMESEHAGQPGRCVSALCM